MLQSSRKLVTVSCHLCRSLSSTSSAAFSTSPSFSRIITKSSRSEKSKYGPKSEQRWTPNQSRNNYPSIKPTPAILLKRLDLHLRKAWKDCTGSVAELGSTLDLNHSEYAVLVRQFATEGITALENRINNGKGKSTGGVEWDSDLLMEAYELHGDQCVQQVAASTFLQWASTKSSNIPTAIGPPSALAKLRHFARIVDYRNPGEMFPFARQNRRKLILHVGPTNSGKTYSALIALSRARTGVYAGPLRLLAHEVFTRFNEGKIGNEGKRVCNLITGEEQRILDPNATLSSCTVEMFPLNRRLDVGVIDEIQMIGDVQRGSAWTNAVLGCQCDELHLCGEESVVELIQSMAKDLGDECEVRRYERLSPLKVSEKSLESDISKVKRGDCVVTFSRTRIFGVKREIEQKTGLKVAVAYGGLPPEVREEQARAFNAGEYDVLVASDAVGMGLNLKIQRMIFETMYKWDPKSRSEVPLAMPQIKQIAGRAGRFGFNSTDPNGGTIPGEATTLHEADMTLLNEAMMSSMAALPKAALGHTYETLREFTTFLPTRTRQSTSVGLLSQLAVTSSNFYAVPFQSVRDILDAIQHIHPMTLSERHRLSACPANLRDENVRETLVQWFESFAAGKKVNIQVWMEANSLFSLVQRIDEHRESKVESTESSTSSDTPNFASFADRANSIFTPAILASIESYHRCLTLYLWLSYRAPDIFCDSTTAGSLRRKLELSIDYILAGMKFARVIRIEKKDAKKVINDAKYRENPNDSRFRQNNSQTQRGL